MAINYLLVPESSVLSTVSSDNAKMPIVDAARRGNYELLDECLSAGVSVNALDKTGCSALHGAAQGGHIHCLMRLLKEPKLEINLQVCFSSSFLALFPLCISQHIII